MEEITEIVENEMIVPEVEEVTAELVNNNSCANDFAKGALVGAAAVGVCVGAVAFVKFAVPKIKSTVGNVVQEAKDIKDRGSKEYVEVDQDDKSEE